MARLLLSLNDICNDICIVVKIVDAMLDMLGGAGNWTANL
jgi:hypothetical protein